MSVVRFSDSFGVLYLMISHVSWGKTKPPLGCQPPGFIAVHGQGGLRRHMCDVRGSKTRLARSWRFGSAQLQLQLSSFFLDLFRIVIVTYCDPWRSTTSYDSCGRWISIGCNHPPTCQEPRHLLRADSKPCRALESAASGASPRQLAGPRWTFHE